MYAANLQVRVVLVLVLCGVNLVLFPIVRVVAVLLLCLGLKE